MTKHDIRAAALAVSAAEKSVLRQKHGAVIFRHSYIISKGFNQAKTHPRASNYTFPYIHAELDAALKAKDEDLDGTSMAVVRINKRGRLVNSLPCPDCMDLISKIGIKYLIYSSNKGLIKTRI